MPDLSRRGFLLGVSAAAVAIVLPPPSPISDREMFYQSIGERYKAWGYLSIPPEGEWQPTRFSSVRLYQRAWDASKIIPWSEDAKGPDTVLDTPPDASKEV